LRHRTSPKPRTLRLLTGLLLLNGCATAPVSSPAITATSNPCALLPVKVYGPAYNKELANEIEAAPKGAMWPLAVTDYIALRDAVKACAGTRT
jgi:hypothetical protein